jgi:hypothetical protein
MLTCWCVWCLIQPLHRPSNGLQIALPTRLQDGSTIHLQFEDTQTQAVPVSFYRAPRRNPTPSTTAHTRNGCLVWRMVRIPPPAVRVVVGDEKWTWCPARSTTGPTCHWRTLRPGPQVAELDARLTTSLCCEIRMVLLTTEQTSLAESSNQGHGQNGMFCQWLWCLLSTIRTYYYIIEMNPCVRPR